MARENFLEDGPWEEREELGLRARAFWRPEPGWLQFGASLIELDPGSAGHKPHVHYGSEEMFFVVSGTPTLRTVAGEETLAPGDVVYCREGREGLHTFANPGPGPARIIAVSAGRFPDVVAYPEDGYGWVATRDPEFPAPAADPGIIARFDLPD